MDKERALMELGIPEDMYNELVELFISQTQEALLNIDQKIKSVDYVETAKLAHFIKGSAGNLRIDDIYELAKKIELDAKAGKDILQITNDVVRLKNIFENLKVNFGK